MPDTTTLRLSHEGPGAILADAADGAFSPEAQAIIWRMASALKAMPGVIETVPGMNNLMIVFDPVATDIGALEAAIRTLFHAGASEADRAGTGRIIDVPVVYGSPGTDLADFAAIKGLSPEDVVAAHVAPLYSVAAVGAMPGFVYLSGLDPRLSAPRRTNPRGDVPAGSVMIGGAQTGIMPITAPSGWHVLGRTALALFDPMAEPPVLFKAGDRLRFVAAEIVR